MVTLANVVGTGDLGVEVDIELLADDVDLAVTRYDPDAHPGLYLRFTEEEPLITLYRTGKYNITGCASDELLYDVKDRFLSFVAELGIIQSSRGSDFEVKNYVFTADLGSRVDLSALALQLGMEHVEYEPEQFPAAVYRPENSEVTMLVFNSGRVVFAGAKSKESTEDAVKRLKNEIPSLL